MDYALKPRTWRDLIAIARQHDGCIVFDRGPRSRMIAEGAFRIAEYTDLELTHWKATKAYAKAHLNGREHVLHLAMVSIDRREIYFAFREDGFIGALQAIVPDGEPDPVCQDGYPLRTKGEVEEYMEGLLQNWDCRIGDMPFDGFFAHLKEMTCFEKGLDAMRRTKDE